MPDCCPIGSDHDSKATYRIVVRGRLDSSWSARLSDMTITTELDADSTTTLIGPLDDQAALAGILNTLYELGLTLVSVEYVSGLDFSEVD
jgi:hypothetical protein